MELKKDWLTTEELDNKCLLFHKTNMDRQKDFREGGS